VILPAGRALLIHRYALISFTPPLTLPLPSSYQASLDNLLLNNEKLNY